MPWALHLRHEFEIAILLKQLYSLRFQSDRNFVDFIKRQDTCCHHIHMFFHTVCSSKRREDTYTDISIQQAINLQDAAANLTRKNGRNWRRKGNSKKSKKLNTDRRESENEEKRRKVRRKVYLPLQWIYKVFYMTSWSSMCKTGCFEMVHIYIYTHTHTPLHILRVTKLNHTYSVQRSISLC
jgi:hypothetical protein